MIDKYIIKFLEKIDNFTDSISRQQAENIYYVETGRFLPKMTLSRQREVVKVNT